MKSYDIGIIGAGIAGVFAALRLAEKHKDLKVVVFEFGPPPPNCLRVDPIATKRRRRQLEGWMGCFPTGDGRIYLEEDTEKVLRVVDGRRVRGIKDWFSDQLSEIHSSKLISSKQPSQEVKRIIEEKGFDLVLHKYQQWVPDDIHQLSKISAERIEETGNILLSFDTEVFDFRKNGRKFTVSTSQGDFNCKKLILTAGRTGWRWINKLYTNLGILQDPKISIKYGVRVEMPTSALKGFHKAHCSLFREDLEIGPLNWMGSIIQEDHADMTIAAFRANEERWKTDKVFFSVKKKMRFEDAPFPPPPGFSPGDSCSYINRVAQLSHCLSGERVGREKITSFIRGNGDLVQMPEYNWVPGVLKELSFIFPNLVSRGYFHVPDIDTNVNSINISGNLETDVKGLFVAGESAGIKGIAAAGITGACAAEGAAK